MRPENMSKKRKRRKFTPEYKAEVVRLCQQSARAERWTLETAT